MFTGIVQGFGIVQGLHIDRSSQSGELTIEPGFAVNPFGVEIGESVAVNGCCLTAVSVGATLRFDLSPETLSRTAMGTLGPGARVNLERAMEVGDRFGGHIVQGHIDATGTIESIESSGNSQIFRFLVPAEFDRYLIDKGSVAIDGISLTVVNSCDGRFEAWVIPHTLSETNLGAKRPGDRVNVEFDVIAKYVEKLVGARN